METTLLRDASPAVFSSHSYGDVTIVGEWPQNLTFFWHSWPLSSEGSLACHTYFDTGHQFINGHLKVFVKLHWNSCIRKKFQIALNLGPSQRILKEKNQNAFNRSY